MNELNVVQPTTLDDDIILTERAAQEVFAIREKNSIPAAHALRLGVKGGGCSGLSYVLAFDDAVKEKDIVLEKHGVRILIDQKSMFYLSGTTLDFTDGLNGRGFVFNNPQAAKTCGCGSSFGV
ncbi:MAG: iron-sulfur cluster assembly accessory protein [Bacteroidetes bacterium]|nr:MAG: iron-sulfur cluster assembly accessory protein [Bacteroidota bacterium]